MTQAADTAETIPDLVREHVERRLRFHLLELPILPQVAGEALQLCQSSEPDVREMAKILHRDQALAGNVLRLANSPMFGASVEITSLQQAIGRIGIRRITEVVLMVATKSTTFDTPEAWSPCVDNLPVLSLLSALYAREVASSGPFDAGTAFLAGLLHDMGWPVLLLVLQNLEAQEETKYDLAVAMAVGDAFHTAVAVDLARKWKLSTDVVNAINHHEDWAKWEPIPTGAAVVALADQLARAALPAAPETAKSVLAHPANAALGLDEDRVTELLGLGERILEMANSIQ